MFLILKLVLIILINNINEYITQDMEIILLPACNPTGAEKIPLTFKVFGKLIQLNLRPKYKIVSPAFEVWKYNAKDVTKKLSELKTANFCIYVHKDHISSAHINFCQEHGLEGLVFMKNDVLEIRPLRNVFAPLSFSNDFCVREQINQSIGKFYVIKKSLQNFASSDLYHLNNIRLKREDDKVSPKEQQKVIIELAIFVGSDAVEAFRENKPMNLEEIRNMMLEYVNNMQTYFHLPSLGVTIDIALIHLEIMEKPPSNLFVSKNSRRMLESFCQYAKTLNPPNEDPHHWDIGLYVTTQDFFLTRLLLTEHEPRSFNYVKITGRTYPDKACRSDMSCAIVKLYSDEIGTSTLISSLYAVYEIGILLGLNADTESRRDLAYIMSPKRPSWRYVVRYEGDIIWSSRSRNMIKKKLENKLCLQNYGRPTATMIKYSDDNNDNNNDWSLYAFNNSRYHGLPGRQWTPKAQCELLLRDKDANAVTLHDICQNLQCETPNKDWYYFSGPSLEGTHCAHKKECRDGECVPIIEPPYNFNFCKKDNWSEWKKDSCKSHCLTKSKGAVVERRYCTHQFRRTGICRRPYYDTDLCDDSILCVTKRTTVDDFATTTCTEMNKLSKDISLKNKDLKFYLLTKRLGRQFPHNVKKPWIACTIHCQQNQSSGYYPMRQKMLHYGVIPYFPDGTWCHNENGQNYYCRQHHCQLENYSFEKSEY